MPFLDHLEELRWRILYSLLAVVVGTLVGWVIVEHVDVIALLIQPIKPLIPGGKLRVTSPTDPFFITLKFAFVVGLVLASPVVGYQAWAFLTPALYERERRLIIPALSAGALLFLAGASAAYLWVLPRALAVLLSFQHDVFDPLITADKYFAFAAQLIIAFGVVTELPLVVVILAILGLVTPQFLARNRRYAIAISAVASALLAPPDAVSMLLMMGPLWLLYEVSIWCAWVVEKRRRRRQRAEGAGGAGGAASAAALGVLLLFALGGSLRAQIPGQRPLRPQRPDTARAAGDTLQGRALDSTAARKLGLPTGPSRSFPPPDAVIDSLKKVKGYRLTQYTADTMIVQGGDSETIHLRGTAYVEREGTKVESDSIRYQRQSCRLDAVGDPKLFDQATVLVGEAMAYDTCVKRGTVHNALTDFQQGSAHWLVRGDLAVDSGSTRLYGANSKITSDENPVPDYHFATGQMKWLNKNVMVARPAVLYIHDVPIMWLPFIFQDVRRGRRSGILVPRFGLSDIVRPTRRYQRHVANLGYYFVVNDYVDFLVSGDWYADRYLAVKGQTRYRWLDHFINGGLSFERYAQLDIPGSSIRLGWQHQQSFSSRTSFNASVDYATSTSVIQNNTVNPYLSTASLGSQMSFNRQFDWGTLTVGGSRHQEIGSGLVTQTFPTVNLTPSPVNITPDITWSPGFSYNNQQTFHQLQAPVLLPGGVQDSVFADTRHTDLHLDTPLRLGRWAWTNNFVMTDDISNARKEVDITDDSTHAIHRVVYYQTFSTTVDWQTGINLPSFFTGTWKLQPSVSIVNQTSQASFRIRNQFTGGQWVQQGKRLQFSASLSPTFFGFFPGIGPIERIRHSVSPSVSYAYAPGTQVSAEFAHAVDPSGRNFRALSDPQQTISLGLSQNFEAKLKPPPGDTTGHAERKIRLLNISTSSLSYNFEQAKQLHHTGWQTPTMTNTLASDLLPGFNFTMTHDLWNGQVGTDSARFDPFLTNIQAGFTITPATIRGITSLLGLGGKAPANAPAPPPAGTEGQPGVPPAGGQFGNKSFQGPGAFPTGGAGSGFNLSVTYSRLRTRPHALDTLSTGVLIPTGTGGNQQLTFRLSFQPTAHWSATWNSSYDFDTQQFGMHVIQLERDLHRWHASFSFNKTPTGSFAFSFYVSLLDQPDIKFNYEQSSITR